jgi:hypothetical protein
MTPTLSRDEEPELTPTALGDLRALGTIFRRLLVEWLRQFSQGRLSGVEIHPLYLPDSSITRAVATGGLNVIYRPLRDAELLELDRLRPQIMVLRIVTPREMGEAKEELRRALEDLEDEDG